MKYAACFVAVLLALSTTIHAQVFTVVLTGAVTPVVVDIPAGKVLEVIQFTHAGSYGPVGTIKTSGFPVLSSRPVNSFLIPAGGGGVAADDISYRNLVVAGPRQVSIEGEAGSLSNQLLCTYKIVRQPK